MLKLIKHQVGHISRAVWMALGLDNTLETSTLEGASRAGRSKGISPPSGIQDGGRALSKKGVSGLAFLLMHR